LTEEEEERQRSTIADESLLGSSNRWLLFISIKGEVNRQGEIERFLCPEFIWKCARIKRRKMNHRILIVWTEGWKVKDKEEFSACRLHEVRGLVLALFEVMVQKHNYGRS
jgi:hypothetical protein